MLAILNNPAQVRKVCYLEMLQKATASRSFLPGSGRSYFWDLNSVAPHSNQQQLDQAWHRLRSA
jgi:hypothetical protein